MQKSFVCPWGGQGSQTRNVLSTLPWPACVGCAHRGGGSDGSFPPHSLSATSPRQAQTFRAMAQGELQLEASIAWTCQKWVNVKRMLAKQACGKPLGPLGAPNVIKYFPRLVFDDYERPCPFGAVLVHGSS